MFKLLAAGALMTFMAAPAGAENADLRASVAIGSSDIGGMVHGANGPEAGVWVIAETQDLGTRFAKIVVTDEQGRFLIPDLPKASYRVWVRGYGLVDSQKVASEPGHSLDLQAMPAPDRAAAAQYYPAIYWFSLLRPPDPGSFPGSGPNGNGIPSEFETRDQWLDVIKTNGCGNCHQIGNYATRTIPPPLGHLSSALAAWGQRLQSGPGGTSMVRTMGRLLSPDGGHLAALADWTDRIKAGELPRTVPDRPMGIERNLVLTIRDWLDPQHYLHDLAATDKRDPTVNAGGPLYGATELSSNTMPVLDPTSNKKWQVEVPVRDPKDTPSSAQANPVFADSPYLGGSQVWDSKVNAHSPAMDANGRIYFTAQSRPPNTIPSYCRKDSPLRSAQLYPLTTQHDGFNQNSRQVTVYDPKTQRFTFIDTCFGTQHLNFAEDADSTLWLSNNTQGHDAVVGWINTRKFWQTGNAAQSQGWTALIVDTNANGKRDADYNEPGKPVDAGKDTRVPFGLYGISYSPLDGSIWGSSLPHPGYILRIDPGPNPPDSALTEVYRVPLPGYGIRGMDIDRNGVVWVPLDSGHIGSFDRRKCKGPLNGPGAEKGNKCPEGWTFRPLPGPSLEGDIGAAENPYYVWVDQHNALGLGPNTPIATGNQSDSLHALVDSHIVELRVPYPMGFFAKQIDGRVDDVAAAWRGRGLWVTSGNRTPFHIEAVDAPAPGAPGTSLATLSSPLVVQFQLRPDPLAH
jgi:hypothetical protein